MTVPETFSDSIGLTPEYVDTTIKAMEQILALDGVSGEIAKSDSPFGAQLMEEVDIKNVPVATGGPTWERTGSTQDPIDGDKGGSKQYSGL
jgi:hypothetical protein